MYFQFAIYVKRQNQIMIFINDFLRGNPILSCPMVIAGVHGPQRPQQYYIQVAADCTAPFCLPGRELKSMAR